jgi:hypothetical protein
LDIQVRVEVAVEQEVSVVLQLAMLTHLQTQAVMVVLDTHYQQILQPS